MDFVVASICFGGFPIGFNSVLGVNAEFCVVALEGTILPPQKVKGHDFCPSPLRAHCCLFVTIRPSVGKKGLLGSAVLFWDFCPQTIIRSFFHVVVQAIFFVLFPHRHPM